MGRLNSGPFLLDTHAFIWAITAPDRLGVEARTAIEAGDSQLMVSAACAWEIATKHRLGKLEKADVLVAGHGRHTSRLRAIDAAITAEHALLAGSLDWEHRDPFDRMLAAQAMLEGWTLITRDSAFAALPGVRVLW